jgi:nucleoid-associated protein YgaU
MAIAPLPDPELLDALTATRPALRLLPNPGGGAGAADPVVLGPDGPRRSIRPSWRRRGLLILGASLVAALAAPVAALAGTAGDSGARPVVGTTYVVRPGDTLWSIAATVDPTGPGPLAAQMAAETGSASVVAGEHIHIP